jgi:putative ABC transport system permease protein
MFSYNLKLIFRRLVRDRQFTILNLLGLSTGLAAAILIYFWVHDEYSMNSGFKKSDRLYQVMCNFKMTQGIITVDKSPVPLSEALLKDMPEVENIVPVNDFFTTESSIGVLSFENKKFESKGWFAGKDFFNVFSYELLQGNKDEALKEESSIAISETLAKKIFGTAANAYGKTVQWKNRDFHGIFRVSGVFKTPPDNTTGEFDLLINIGMLLLIWT